MTSYTRAAIVFVITWIVLFFVISAMWTGEAPASSGLLFGGVISILVAVTYGMFDEAWIAH